MSSNGAELWIAIVGAGAWVPQIFGWIQRQMVRPQITPYLAGNVEVGFTNEGPALGLPLIMRVREKDCVVTGAIASVRHQQGETHDMRWKWLSEVKGVLTGIPAAAPLVFQQSELAIAIPLSTKDVMSRRINFREVGFEVEMQKRMVSVAHALEDVEGERRAGTREWKDAVEWYRNTFFWREGTYSVNVDFTVPDVGRPTKVSFSFNLTRADLASIQENVQNFVRQRELALRDPSDPNANGPISWNWCFPMVTGIKRD